jgi:D-alanyl-D-alanine carboxypeptidase
MLSRKKLYVSALAIAGTLFILFFLLKSFRRGPDEFYWKISSKWRDIIFDEINEPGSIPQIDSSVVSFMEKYDVPGLSIAVAKDDKLIYTKGYGYADVTTGEKVKTTSLFRLCSVSKPFTSAAIMKLLEEGKLSMNSKVFGDDGILRYDYGTLPYRPGMKEITVSDLLHHTSGGWPKGNGDPMFVDPSLTAPQLLSWTIDNQPLKNVPGTTYQYSNFGYFVLGRVIEKLTGRSYAAYVNSMILQPAGISDMQIGGNIKNEKKTNEVTYYGQFGDPYNFNVTRMDANGGWIGSASDLLRFVVSIDGVAYKKDILDSSTIKIMLTPSKAGATYACGWGSKNNFTDWYHTGGLPGSATELSNTSVGFSWAILVNSNSDKMDFYKDLDSIVWKAIKDSTTHWPGKDLF